MKKIYWFKKVTSTQDKARSIAGKATGKGAVIASSVQTAGRGRFGKEWFSPKGGLWFSILLYPEISPKEASMLTMVAGVAVIETLKVFYDIKVEMKWPNDIVVKDKKGGLRKVGGILTEASIKNKKLEYVIIGAGINVNNNIDRKALKASSIRTISGRKLDLKKLLNKILMCFDTYYFIFIQSGRKTIIDKCRELMALTGRKVIVDNGGKLIKGIVSGIADDGSLLLKSGGKRIKILAGEVKLMK